MYGDVIPLYGDNISLYGDNIPLCGGNCLGVEALLLIRSRERLVILYTKNSSCAIVIIADGFEETDTIITLSLLRQAGLCVKSVGLTSGLIGSVCGVRLMPDLVLADLDHLNNGVHISVAILPEGRQSLLRLEADPRVHRLLRRVVAQRGQIVTGPEGLRVPRAASLWVSNLGEDYGSRLPVLLRDPNQPTQVFIRELIQKLKEPR